MLRTDKSSHSLIKKNDNYINQCLKVIKGYLMLKDTSFFVYAKCFFALNSLSHIKTQVCNLQSIKAVFCTRKLMTYFKAF